MTALSTLAASMTPGTWAQLTTTIGYNYALVRNGISGCNPDDIFVYADSAQWDPNLKQMYFLGAPHCAPISVNPLANGFKFLTFDDATSSWSACTWLDDFPGCWCSDIPFQNHGFDHLALDPVTRDMYVYISTSVYMRNLDTLGPWVPDPTGIYDGLGGLSWFPEMGAQGGLVLFRGGFGQIAFWDKATDPDWVIDDGNTMGPYHNFSEYNPVHHCVVGGGGNGDTHIYKVTADRTITAMAAAPVGLGVTNARFMCDPVTGMYLVLAGDTESFWQWDVTTDAWTQLPDAPFVLITEPEVAMHHVITCQISTYGVVMVCRATGGDGEIWLYKHAAFTPPPPTDEKLVVVFA